MIFISVDNLVVFNMFHTLVIGLIHLLPLYSFLLIWQVGPWRQYSSAAWNDHAFHLLECHKFVWRLVLSSYRLGYFFGGRSVEGLIVLIGESIQNWRWYFHLKVGSFFEISRMRDDHDGSVRHRWPSTTWSVVKSIHFLLHIVQCDCHVLWDAQDVPGLWQIC